jgi:hypothetical protein
MFTQALPERWVRFEGLNTADGNRKMVIDRYRAAINPAKELSVITDELLKFELSGQVLADTLTPPPATSDSWVAWCSYREMSDDKATG